MRPTRDQWGLALAKITATRATCVRRKVGCVLLNRRGQVVATGYNGVASGLPHCTEGCPCSGAYAKSGTNLDACQAIHAEQNALLQCRDVYDIHSAYVTTSPCITCVKLLLNTSCERILFTEEYPHIEARKIWEGAGREWIKV